MPPVYEVLLERRAERDIQRLPKEVFDRIIPHLKALSENPKPSGCRKISGSRSDWRIRIGDYRVIYEVSEQEQVVKVMRIRHRKSVYR
jgi:mRNA interferase RelE/StbE